MKTTYRLILALAFTLASLAVVACSEDAAKKKPVVDQKPTVQDKPVMAADPPPAGEEGKDYFPIYLSFQAPNATDATYNLDRFLSQNKSGDSPFGFSFLETNENFNLQDTTMVSFDRLEFLTYKDRKLILTVQVNTAAGNKTPASFLDKTNYADNFTASMQRQTLSKEVSYNDLLTKKVFVGYYVFSKVGSNKFDPNTQKWISVSAKVSDPFYAKFMQTGSPVLLSATDASFSLLSFKSTQYAVDEAYKTTVTSYFPIDYLVPKNDVSVAGKNLPYADRITLQSDWQNNDFAYNLVIPQPPTKDNMLSTRFTGRFMFNTTKNAWIYDRQTQPGDKMPKFFVLRGNTSVGSPTTDNFVFAYPPIIVYSKEFSADKNDQKKALEVFFKEVDLAFASKGP